MGIGLAAAIAGRRHPHQPGVLAILHIADKNAILDQRRPAGRRALIVDAQGTATVWNRAVIDNGDAWCCNSLPHQSSEGRRLLAIEIAFQSMADSFMEQNARPSGPKNDVQCTGRRRYGFQIDQRLAQGLIHTRLPVFRRDDPFEAFPAAATKGACLLAVVRTGDHTDAHANHRPDIADPVAVGA